MRVANLSRQSNSILENNNKFLTAFQMLFKSFSLQTLMIKIDI